VARGRSKRSNVGGKQVGPAKSRAAERDLRLAIYRFQDSAYHNLRNAIANVAVFCGAFAVYALAIGSVDGVRVWPSIVFLLAGILGVGYYLTRAKPKISLYLLIAASVTVVIGVASLIVATLR
jgi:hypothetical protein